MKARAGPLSSSNPSPTHAYRSDIDGIRALAIALVIAFHARVPGFEGGYIGVDVFFVISGYLISGIIFRAIDTGTFSFSGFYERRIRRIIPALVVILFAVALLGWLFLFTRELTRLGKHVFAGATFVSNFVLVQETGYFDSPHKPLLHLWSLAVEEQFYFFWPAVALLVRRMRWNARWTIIALIGISFVSSVWMVRHSMAISSFYLPVTRFWEILAGALLYDFEAHPGNLNTILRKVNAQSADVAAFFGLVLIFLSVLLFDEATPWPGLGGLLPVAGTVLLIGGGLKSRISRVLFGNRLLVGIGLISYPLYLWHWPILVFAELINEDTPSAGARFASIVAAVILSMATYRWIESPIRFGPRKARTVLILMVFLAGAGLLGLALWVRVIPARLDASEIRNLERWGANWDAPSGRLVNQDRALQFSMIPGTNSDTVVILGDSHAEQYWPRIEELAAERHGDFPTVLLLTYGSCPPIPNANHVGLSWQKNKWRCDDIYRAVRNVIDKPGVKVVVFAAFWEGYLMRGTLFLTDDPRRRVITAEGDAVRLLFCGFERELRRFEQSGKKTYIVLSNPTRPTRTGADRPRRLAGFGQPVDEAPISIDFVNSRRGNVTEKLRDVASRSNTTVIDPAEVLCGTDSCATFEPDGMPIYRDSHHLRSGFVRTRATFLDEIFDR